MHLARGEGERSLEGDLKNLLDKLGRATMGGGDALVAAILNDIGGLAPDGVSSLISTDVLCDVSHDLCVVSGDMSCDCCDVSHDCCGVSRDC